MEEKELLMHIKQLFDERLKGIEVRLDKIEKTQKDIKDAIIAGGINVDPQLDGVMTDRDMNLILMQDDILAGIDAWNRQAKERKKLLKGGNVSPRPKGRTK